MISNLLTEITDAGSQHLQKVLSIFIYKIKGGGAVSVFSGPVKHAWKHPGLCQLRKAAAARWKLILLYCQKSFPELIFCNPKIMGSSSKCRLCTFLLRIHVFLSV